MFRFAQSTSSIPRLYDTILHIEKLDDLFRNGWRFEAHESSTNYENCLSVGILGLYNRGKSFLLNKLCQIHCPTGRLIYTRGLSITGPRIHNKNLIFIDTAGTDTPTKNENLDDKRAIEALLREIVLNMCSYVIIVMNRLQLTDQIYIREILEYCEKQSSSNVPEIIFVHNIWDLETEEDVKVVIKKEIEEILGAKLKTIQSQNVKKGHEMKVYCSTVGERNLQHFILAKDGSDAGDCWNEQTVNNLMSILQGDLSHRRNIDIFNEVLQYINERLPQLLSNGKDSNEDLSKIKVLQHKTEPYLVLSELTDMPLAQRKTYECSLTVTPRLLYDQSGYLVGIVSNGAAKWTPRYQLYKTADHVTIFVEIAGLNEANIDVEAIDNVITIKGERAKPEGVICQLVPDRLEFPMGPFELKISITEDIESDKVKFELKDGIFTATYPIRKHSMKTFGGKLEINKETSQ